jgi:ABC-type branched-subunit amino acid transport system permease subunit
MDDKVAMLSFEALIPIAFFAAVAFIIKIILDYKLRKQLIEKGVTKETIKNLYPDKTENVLTSLKWGLVLVGVGIGGFVGQLGVIPAESTGGIILSMMLILGGASLVIYYIIAPKIMKQSEKQTEIGSEAKNHVLDEVGP